MNIFGKIEDKVYDCWMCGEKYNNAAQYLLHINTCKMKAQPILTKQ
jgi:hypothetical protein